MGLSKERSGKIKKEECASDLCFDFVFPQGFKSRLGGGFMEKRVSGSSFIVSLPDLLFDLSTHFITNSQPNMNKKGVGNSFFSQKLITRPSSSAWLETVK